MYYEFITRKLQEALEDTYKVTSQKWFDKQWQGVDAIIKVMNVELSYIFDDQQYTAYVKYVDGLMFENKIKTYSIAIKDKNDKDVIFGKIYCHAMGTENPWSWYALSCMLNREEY